MTARQEDFQPELAAILVSEGDQALQHLLEGNIGMRSVDGIEHASVAGVQRGHDQVGVQELPADILLPEETPRAADG